MAVVTRSRFAVRDAAGLGPAIETDTETSLSGARAREIWGVATQPRFACHKSRRLTHRTELEGEEAFS